MKHIKSTTKAKAVPMVAEGQGSPFRWNADQIVELMNGVVCQYKPEKEKCAEA